MCVPHALQEPEDLEVFFFTHTGLARRQGGQRPPFGGGPSVNPSRVRLTHYMPHLRSRRLEAAWTSSWSKPSCDYMTPTQTMLYYKGKFLKFTFASSLIFFKMGLNFHDLNLLSPLFSEVFSRSKFNDNSFNMRSHALSLLAPPPSRVTYSCLIPET